MHSAHTIMYMHFLVCVTYFTVLTLQADYCECSIHCILLVHSVYEVMLVCKYCSYYSTSRIHITFSMRQQSFEFSVGTFYNHFTGGVTIQRGPFRHFSTSFYMTDCTQGLLLAKVSLHVGVWRVRRAVKAVYSAWQ